MTELKQQITNLVIPENVKTIGKSAFAFNIIKL